MTGAQLQIKHYDPDGVTHSHDFHQAVLPLKGGLEMEIGGRGGLVSLGQAALVTGGNRHSFAGAGDNAFLILDAQILNAPDEQARLWELGAKQPFVALDSSFATLSMAIAEEVSFFDSSDRDDGPAGRLLLDALERRLLGPRAWSQLDASDRARQVMEARCCDPTLDMAEIADLVGLSVSALHRRFKARYGVSPMRHLTERRLERAAQLLTSSDQPLVELGLAVGYGDQSAFTRAFRRHHGLPPAEYRALARQKRHKAQ